MKTLKIITTVVILLSVLVAITIHTLNKIENNLKAKSEKFQQQQVELNNAGMN